MTPEEEKKWRLDGEKTSRCGEPTREKWGKFLDRALELQYLSVEEYTERMGAVREAQTISQINDALRIGEFSFEDIDDWCTYWDGLRKRGLQPYSTLVPPKTAPRPDPCDCTKVPGVALVILTVLAVVFFTMLVAGVR